MFFTGLTGGIATGKSTVRRFFESRGFRTLDADGLSHELLLPGGVGVKPVIEAFGQSILSPGGGIDRKALGSVVFKSDEKRNELNRIMHSLVRKRMKEEIKKIRVMGYDGILILDIPLLGDTMSTEGFDAVVLVTCRKEIQVERLTRLRKMSYEEAAERIAAQVPVESKERFADFIIRNDGTIADLKKKTMQVAASLEAMSARHSREHYSLPWADE